MNRFLMKLFKTTNMEIIHQSFLLGIAERHATETNQEMQK